MIARALAAEWRPLQGVLLRGGFELLGLAGWRGVATLGTERLPAIRRQKIGPVGCPAESDVPVGAYQHEGRLPLQPIGPVRLPVQVGQNGCVPTDEQALKL